jgi:acyl-CoA reductase-like NAD-dependent aldehyde dehydrogenase
LGEDDFLGEKEGSEEHVEVSHNVSHFVESLITLSRFVLNNQEILARVACLDSGKTMVDAALGEILVTAEKLQWMIDHGEAALRPERRPTNFLMMYKWNEVLFEPLGVVAACVSWK